MLHFLILAFSLLQEVNNPELWNTLQVLRSAPCFLLVAALQMLVVHHLQAVGLSLRATERLFQSAFSTDQDSFMQNKFQIPQSYTKTQIFRLWIVYFCNLICHLFIGVLRMSLTAWEQSEELVWWSGLPNGYEWPAAAACCPQKHKENPQADTVLGNSWGELLSFD